MEHQNYLPMKELPSDDRPYEKLERLGARSLTDAELLSVLIRSGTRSMPALQLCQKIMAQADDRGLRQLCEYSLEELMSIPGIGKVKALQIKAAIEIGNRVAGSAGMRLRKQIRTPDDARALLEVQLRFLPREELHMVMLDIRNRVIRIARLSEGGLSSAIVKPRDLFREAVKSNAAAVILAHNHPSGDAAPSHDDIETTQKLMDIGNIMGVKVIDHFVISATESISMRQSGLI